MGVSALPELHIILEETDEVPHHLTLINERAEAAGGIEGDKIDELILAILEDLETRIQAKTAGHPVTAVGLKMIVYESIEEMRRETEGCGVGI